MHVRLPPSFLMQPLAHRAWHKRSDRRPENSPAAISAALVAGYGIEIDVQLSRDSQAMVFHDERLERLTREQGFLRDRNAAELAGIRLNDCDDGIPTLSAVLSLVAGQVPLLIEIKDQTGAMTETDTRLETAVAHALSGYRGPVAVMSFNPYAIAHMARLAPGVPRGLTTSAYDPADWAPLLPDRCAELRNIPDYDRTMASFISHEAADLGRDRVAVLKAQGAAILTWTIRSPDEEAKARLVAQNITFENYTAVISA